jgi:hypothetical protein
VPTMIGSTPVSGRAPCAPTPVMSTSKNAPPAIIGPERTAKRPTASFGRLCMPKIASHGKRSNSRSSIIAFAPPSPSSAGWNTKCTVPSNWRVAASTLAAPSSIAVWPSWPQACMQPAWRERCSKVLASSIGSASMSARRPIVREDVPLRSTPTTPVRPTPRCTSMPNDSRRCATSPAVRLSAKPSSGWAWMSRRQAVNSAW